jgi:hypothetical protein
MIGLAATAAVVAMIVGRPVPIACQSPSAYADGPRPTFAAYVWMHDGRVQDTIYASPLLCSEIADTENIAAQGVAVYAIVHESEHIALDTLDEATVECATLGALRGVLARLGLPEIVQRAMEKVGWSAHLSEPASYITDCQGRW